MQTLNGKATHVGMVMPMFSLSYLMKTELERNHPILRTAG